MNILFTICGRAGSKGFQNKNLKKMNGIPLVYFTMATIRLFRKEHRDDVIYIAVNTDSKPLVEYIKALNVLNDIIFVARKDELAGDLVAKLDVIRDTYQAVERGGKIIDVVIDLDITSPMRRVVDIENALHVYESNLDYDLVASVVPARRNPYFNMIEKKGAFYKKICESKYTTRQEAPHTYELNASIYAFRPIFLKKDTTNTLLDNRCGISVMEDYLVLDIDSEKDFRMMEFLHKFYCERDEGIREVYKEAATYVDS